MHEELLHLQINIRYSIKIDDNHHLSGNTNKLYDIEIVNFIIESISFIQCKIEGDHLNKQIHAEIRRENDSDLFSPR
jgi:hypothetical protein